MWRFFILFVAVIAFAGEPETNFVELQKSVRDTEPYVSSNDLKTLGGLSKLTVRAMQDVPSDRRDLFVNYQSVANLKIALLFRSKFFKEIETPQIENSIKVLSKAAVSSNLRPTDISLRECDIYRPDSSLACLTLHLSENLSYVRRSCLLENEKVEAKMDELIMALDSLRAQIREGQDGKQLSSRLVIASRSVDDLTPHLSAVFGRTSKTKNAEFMQSAEYGCLVSIRWVWGITDFITQ